MADTISNIAGSGAETLVSGANFSSQIGFISDIVDNMLSGANKRIMIGGDTGLGKSSFVRQFSKILGLPLIVIEVPHAIEEQLINIPFVIFKPTGEVISGADKLEKTEFGVQLAKSNLASQLASLTKLPDAAYNERVKTLDRNSQALLQQYNQEYPDDIRNIRAKYQRILFLDEYFRQTTPAIRNILRNILNGQIGNDRIPPGTYVMYATNLHDKGGSIDKQSQHTTFLQKEFPAPTVEQWLNYMVSNKGKKSIDWKQDVVDAFKSTLTDEQLSYKDVATDVRTSPRRWSEILLYVNNAYPFQNPEQASILATTLRRQFRNEEQAESPAYAVLEGILGTLIKKSGIDIKEVKPVSPQRWRDVLAQHIMSKEEIGENKKYVPVIQGLPGLGKTAIGQTFEAPPYNLRFIPILATTLSTDSVVGIPLPSKEQGELGTQFGEPELKILIDKQIAAAEKEYYEDLKKQEQSGELEGKTADEAFQDFKNQEYKYLIFFDEINRVKNIAVFNSLRRVILEKEYNDKYKLPEGSIVVGAMNPSDLGTIGLTDHFRDSIDIIDADPDWKDTLGFIKGFVTPSLKKLNYAPSDVAFETALTIIEEFPGTFSDKKRGRKTNEFYINVGEADEIYMSPRDYDNLYRELVAGVDRSIKAISRKMNQGQSFSDDEINSAISKAAMVKIQDTLKDKFYQADIGDPPGFFDKVQQFLDKNINVSLKKKTAQATLGSMLDQAISSPTELKDDFDFDNYMQNYMPAQFNKDFREYLDQKVDQFLSGDGSKIDPEPAETFLINKEPGSLFSIVKQIVDAVDQNDFERGILDQVDDVIFQYFKAANKAIVSAYEDESAAEDFIVKLVENYDEIRSLF